MTRRLPWKRTETSPTSAPNSARSTPVRQQKVKREDSDIDDKTTSSVSKRVKTTGSKRTISEPLPESYMIEGLDHDDIYRMVEDELRITASKFTAHLHQADLKRLEAKSQNADTIRNISRPVVGRMTDLVKTKRERKSRLDKQRAAARKALANKGQDDDETDESGDDSRQSASLYGLMETPRKKAARLDNLTRAVTTTRAAAGFDTVKPRSSVIAPRPALNNNLLDSKTIVQPTLGDNSETADDDDPDTPSVKKTPLSIFQPSNPRPAQFVYRDSPSLRHPTSVTPARQIPKPAPTTKETDSSDDSGGGLFGGLKRRQEDRRRIREQRKLAKNKAQSKQPADNVIPGFL